MDYEVKLLGLAERDIDEICQYLSQFYPGTPGRFLDALEKNFENISNNPKMFPKYEYNKEFRRSITGDFLVFYKIDEENNLVRIYRILHGKRNISTILENLQT
ncbi:MAG: type II toxin-antitoxin system RelE/ParE family toxin [Treponema sp.]|nr:type II toxin-antitoxin system RelE/ParE family toxin [Treponema sp.]